MVASTFPDNINLSSMLSIVTFFILPNVDSILSYFPLNDWMGKTTNIFCFHGYINEHNLKNNSISCKFELWNNSPVSINEVKNNFLRFSKLLMK